MRMRGTPGIWWAPEPLAHTEIRFAAELLVSIQPSQVQSC